MIPIKDLMDYLPHRDEIVWIDYVLEARENGGTSMVIVDRNKHYFGKEELRQSSLIEWMAQGSGFVSAAYYKSMNINKTLHDAFLVGFMNANFSSNLPKESEEVLITSNVTRIIASISYVECSVQSKISGEIYCSALIKLYSN